MCAIIDANAYGDLFAGVGNLTSFLKWMNRGKGCVVYGGTKMKDEITRSPRFRDLLKTWKQAGRARNDVPDPDIDAEEANLVHHCQSDDPHIIALARLSGARVLVLKQDARLEQDFKNPGLIASPRGRIYKNYSHRRLLHHDSACRARLSALPNA